MSGRDAPILVGHRCVPAALRLPKDEDGFVDLRPFAGRTVPVAPKGIRKLLGCDLPLIDQLLEAGALQEDVARRGKLKRYLLVDPTLTLETIHANWFETFPTPASYAEFQRYKDVRRMCRVPASSGHSERILSAALDFLLAMDAIDRSEVRGLLDCTTETAEEIVRWMRRRIGETRRARRFWEKGLVSLQTFRLMLPDEIANAPRTCFDPTFSDMFDPPAPTILARLSRLGPLFEAASIHILRRAGLVRDPRALRNRMLAIEALDQALQAAGHEAVPKSPRSIGVLLTAFALEGTLLPDMRDFPRTLAGLAWETMRNDIKAVMDHASVDARRQIGRWLPPPHDRARRFRRALFKAEQASRDAGGARRKERSDPVADALPAIHEGLARRAEQLKGLADEGHLATLALEAEDRLACKDFEFTSPVLLPDGTAPGGLQTVMMRCWRRAALLHLLAEDESGAAMQRRGPGRPRAGEERQGRSIRSVPESVRLRLAALDDDIDEDVEDGPTTAEDEFYFEYVGTMAADPDAGTETCEPMFITLLRDGTIVCPAMLSADMRERRRDLIIRFGLPGYVGSPAGLLGFGRAGSLVFRAFAEHSTARVIVPLVQFDHAMRIAHLMFCAQVESSCRIGEALQIASLSSDGWEPMPNTGSAIWQFLAVPKQWIDSPDPRLIEDPTRGYPVDDATLVRASELEALLVRRCHGGGAVPAIEPHYPGRWKLVEAPYLASFDGSTIGPDSVNLFFRYFAAGISNFRSHDLRHASARARRRAKASVKQVAAALGNSPKLAGWYSRITKAEAASKARSASERARQRSEKDRRIRARKDA